MDIRNLICIGCPLGCPIKVTLNEAGEINKVEGHTCKRGETYAIKEVTNPTRTITSTVRVCSSSTGAMTVSCKTRTDVPKSKILDIIRDIKDLTVPAPVHIGDVIRKNVADTGVDLIATKDVP